MERREIRFTGRVQGVGFRATARSIAARHAVTGWVRNEPDGSVLMQIQGAPAEIDRTLDELNRAMHRNIAAAESVPRPVIQSEPAFEVRF